MLKGQPGLQLTGEALWQIIQPWATLQWASQHRIEIFRQSRRLRQQSLQARDMDVLFAKRTKLLVRPLGQRKLFLCTTPSQQADKHRDWQKPSPEHARKKR
ncbi:MAG: hypothetical protein IPK22_03000 [Verrucomicrobiaceae bacterium]|nr:hypothetical protein [Verrucomicrobiaceae bacterium]